VTGSGVMGAVGALVVAFGILILTVHILRKVQNVTVGKGCGVPLRLLKRMSLGPKQGVGLLQVGDRVLVISLGDGGTHLLTELDDPKLKAELAAPADSPSPQRVLSSSRLRRLMPFVLAAVMTAGIFLAAVPAGAAPAPPPAGGTEAFGQPYAAPGMDIAIGGNGPGELKLTGPVGLVVFIGLLTLLPALLLLMTSFTRVLIVLQFLRPAMGTQTTPPVQLLVALSLLITGVIMHPVLEESNRTALQPLLKGEITQAQAYEVGIQPFREFMLANTHDKDLGLFAELSGIADQVESMDQIPTLTLASAFVTSELRTAFQMGFLIFIPFIVVDLIVASVLMSLGMFMLPPLMVSLPFKMLLFVLADGWTLVIQNLFLSFR
jgi:flagellar biosynthetic protein FliP